MGWKGTAYRDKSRNNSHFSLLKHVFVLLLYALAQYITDMHCRP